MGVYWLDSCPDAFCHEGAGHGGIESAVQGDWVPLFAVDYILFEYLPCLDLGIYHFA